MYKKLFLYGLFGLISTCLAETYTKTNYNKTREKYNRTKEQTTQTPSASQTVSISPEDEVKDLILDERKYRRNKWGCAITSGISFAAMAALMVLESGGHIQDMIKITTTTAIAGTISLFATAGNWWAETRSHRQAQALADQNDITINEPGYNRVKDDTAHLENHL